jgi:Flp pilus assembly protein TadD
VTWVSPADEQLQNARAHGFIGAAECLYVMGKTNDAIAAALAIDTSAMNQEQRSSVGWIRGLSLFDAERYQEAIPELSLVAARPTSEKHTSDAHALLILALLRSGRFEDAAGSYRSFSASNPASRLVTQVNLEFNARARSR